MSWSSFIIELNELTAVNEFKSHDDLSPDIINDELLKGSTVTRMLFILL